jgi:hypothetical protein
MITFDDIDAQTVSRPDALLVMHPILKRCQLIQSVSFADC